MISEMGDLFARLVSSMSVLIVVAGLLGSNYIMNNEARKVNDWLYAVFAGVMGGMFGIYGNITSMDVNGALVSIRDIGPMMAGFLSGPMAGLIAGIIAGAHRLSMGGVTAQACIVATCLIGLLCGGLSRDLNEKIFTPFWAFSIGAMMEGIHLLLVLAMVRPYSLAESICRQIALPFMLINATGFSLLVFLVRYMAKQRNNDIERNRLQSELQAASVIQHSLLPTVSDRFPGRTEIELVAMMETAKAVGGDFYDFFFCDQNHLAIVMADVSGKGIPAALFMANSKQTIQNCVRDIPDLAEAIFTANNSLCMHNDAEMFVTAWVGVIDLRTGELNFVNAGHNPPVLITRSMAEFIRARGGFVVAGMEDVPYKVSTIRMKKGDKLYLYTDGVTEAETAAHKLYGDDRLLECLNENRYRSVQGIIDKVRASVAIHVNGNDQFDDMTMLCIEYKGASDKEDR